MANLFDLTGQVFGRLIVKEKDGKNKHGNYLWRCECQCGNSTVVTSGNLRKGHTQSCGCIRTERLRELRADNLEEQVFDRLTVLKHKEGSYWECRCACGNSAVVRRDHLTTKKIQSCGCWKKEVSRTHGQSKTAEYRRHTTRKRHAEKQQRVPLWADLEAIRDIYINCPDGYEIDHIIPLRGKLVSGLHVQGNLQYLPVSDNRKKSNKFTPTT